MYFFIGLFLFTYSLFVLRRNDENLFLDVREKEIRERRVEKGRDGREEIEVDSRNVGIVIIY